MERNKQIESVKRKRKENEINEYNKQKHTVIYNEYSKT